MKAAETVRENRTLGAAKSMIGVKDMKILIEDNLIFAKTEKSSSANGMTTRSSQLEVTLQLIYRCKK